MVAPDHEGGPGAGGAVIAPTALALITTNFPQGGERNRAFSVYAAMASAGSAMGLLLGGILTTYLSWRWVLFVNVPIGIVVAAAAPRVLAESPRRPGRIDGPARSPAPAASRCSSTACPRPPPGLTAYRTGVTRRCWHR